MLRLVLCVLALVASGLATPEPAPTHEHMLLTSQQSVEAQMKYMLLYFKTHEPLHLPEHIEIAKTWTLMENISKFKNATAVEVAHDMIENEWVLPQGVPFSILEPNHVFQVKVFFDLLYSAKTYSTFYKTAVYLRNNINEYMFVYILTLAVIHRPDTQGFLVPTMYEIFPSFFNNGEILNTAQRISTQGSNWVEHYPSTYVWDNSIVIRWNETAWPYHTSEMPLAYFTHDYGLSNYYYNYHLMYPSWLGNDTVPLVKDRRGEILWFEHKQIISHYLMERLCNGLGEIQDLSWETVETGFTSGLVWQNGIPYPMRPNYFILRQPAFVEKLQKIVEYQQRMYAVVDQGYYFSPTGEKVYINNPDAIDVLGRLIEGGVDSPNNEYYKDFISIWKIVLGNSYVQEPYYWKGIPWVVPSALEQYQTTLRDPAFYMIWKGVLNIFKQWQEKLPAYKPEELSLPGVKIEKVDVDKLVTYFEYNYMNITNHLYLNRIEGERVSDSKSVLVQRPRLNHKEFSIKLNVQSKAPKDVVVRLFLAPKYDSVGKIIPLQLNTENFFQFDQFPYTLKAGENEIIRSSTENQFFVKDLPHASEVYNRVVSAAHNQDKYEFDPSQKISGFPQRLLLPKGRVGGMTFVMMAYISEFHAPDVAYGTGFDPKVSLGLGSGARHFTSDPLGYPMDRPLHDWQVHGVQNIWFQDVQIYHKPSSEVPVPYTV